MIKTCLLLANLRESSVNSLKMRARVRLFRYTWGGWRDSLSISNLAPKIVVRGLFSPMNVLQSACLFPKIFTVLAVCLACTSVAFSAPCDDDVWMVSTRGLPTICRMPLSAAIGIERLNPAVNCWERSDLQSLLDDPTRPLMIFIHGNRYSTADAKSQALQLARQAKRCCPVFCLVSWAYRAAASCGNYELQLWVHHYTGSVSRSCSGPAGRSQRCSAMDPPQRPNESRICRTRGPL